MPLQSIPSPIATLDTALSRLLAHPCEDRQVPSALAPATSPEPRLPFSTFDAHSSLLPLSPFSPFLNRHDTQNQSPSWTLYTFDISSLPRTLSAVFRYLTRFQLLDNYTFPYWAIESFHTLLLEPGWSGPEWITVDYDQQSWVSGEPRLQSCQVPWTRTRSAESKGHHDPNLGMTVTALTPLL